MSARLLPFTAQAGTDRVCVDWRQLKSPPGVWPQRVLVGANHSTAMLAQASGLADGETAAIALAVSLHADSLLIGESDGFRVAEEQGLHVTGTLGILVLAADRGLIEFSVSIFQLEQTNILRPIELLKTLLTNYEAPKRLSSLTFATENRVTGNDGPAQQ
jgi:hypothetical protein